MSTNNSPITDDRDGAKLSDDRTYRYRLWRTWDTSKPTLAWVMLNPSTADETEDDPTIRRCIGFAKDWGFGGIEVVNLFALRATDPDELREHAKPVGPRNDEVLHTVADEAENVVCAWGANGGLMDRGQTVAGMIDTELHALDTTKDGHPVHPLYQPADADLEVFGY